MLWLFLFASKVVYPLAHRLHENKIRNANRADTHEDETDLIQSCHGGRLPLRHFDDGNRSQSTSKYKQNVRPLTVAPWPCHRQWETDPPGTLNLTHRIRWFLHEGGADAEGGGADGIGGFEEARG